jgi:ribonuclease E
VDAIDGAAKGGKGAFLIYQESSLVIRAIRDYFNSDIGDILIDTDDIYEQAQQFMSHVMPEHCGRVKRYRDDAPLFSRFQIEHQIESAYSRTVNLPSGGAIVIDHTEALVSVDVNSARAITGGDIEETATRTNLEAADEIARQCACATWAA